MTGRTVKQMEDLWERDVRRQTQALVEALEREHPEKECEPRGLRLREEPKATVFAEPQEVAPVPTFPPPVVAGPHDRRAKIEAIVSEVAGRQGVPVTTILSVARTEDAVIARAMIIKHMRDEYGWSFATIGRILNRDHTTCIHGYRKALQLQAAVS